MSKTASSITAIATTFVGSNNNNLPRIPGMPMPEGFDTSDPISSLGELAANVAVSALDLTQAIRTVYCATELISNPMMLLNTVELMAKGATGIALDMAQRMAKLVHSQLTQALSQINGSFMSLTNNALGYIDGLRTFLTSAQKLLQAIGNFVDTIIFGAENEYDDFCKQEDCEFMFAMMAACLLSKLVGNKLQEFEQKVTSKITNTGSSINQALAESLRDVNNISGYLEREKFMMEKAAKQMDGLHRMIGTNSNNKTSADLNTKATAEAQKAAENTQEAREAKKKTEEKASVINQALNQITTKNKK